VLPSDRPLRVAVVGAGLMGTQIGCEYALGGHEATLVARRAELVSRRVAEDFDVKAEVLGRAAEQFPEAVLATNTSSLGITRLGRALGAGRRTLGTHYWNPPLLMPLVELVAGEDTSGEVVDDLERVLRDLGKRPVRVKDVPGFAWNRLQLALLREAVWLVEHGVATPETVFPLLSDAARIDGLERWVPSDAETLDAARQRRDAELADELRREGC
jgi:3-hydroxyacyl-CoA dehydrogenase